MFTSLQQKILMFRYLFFSYSRPSVSLIVNNLTIRILPFEFIPYRQEMYRSVYANFLVYSAVSQSDSQAACHSFLLISSIFSFRVFSIYFDSLPYKGDNNLYVLVTSPFFRVLFADRNTALTSPVFLFLYRPMKLS